MCFGTVVLPALGCRNVTWLVPPLPVNVHPEAMRYDFQILDAPVAGVPPHPLKDLLSLGHEYMVPNTAPLNNVGRVLCQVSGLPETAPGDLLTRLPAPGAASFSYGLRARLRISCKVCITSG